VLVPLSTLRPSSRSRNRFSSIIARGAHTVKAAATWREAKELKRRLDKLTMIGYDWP